jgi:hypothetical protein
MEREFCTEREALAILEERAEELKEEISSTAQTVVDSADLARLELTLPNGFEDRVIERSRSVGRATPPYLAIATCIAGVILLIWLTERAI